MSLSPWSPLSFLLVGLMGGGPVLWLEIEDEEDDDEDEDDEEEDIRVCGRNRNNYTRLQTGVYVKAIRRDWTQVISKW